MTTKMIKRVSFFGFQILIFLGLTVTAQDMKDFDGNVYKTVKLGTNVWTAFNLNVEHFRNGDAIPQAKTQEEWAKAAKSGSPAWCYYDNDTVNGSTYGKLYNWYAINDPRGLAPEGWHVPVNADWTKLVSNLLGVDVAGMKLKSKTAWKKQKGTDNFGFAALPSGCREPEGKFKGLGSLGQWWSNSVPVSAQPSKKIYSVMLNDNTPEISYLESEKGAGLSVRCKKD